MSAAAQVSEPAAPEHSALWMLANIWFEPGKVFAQVARTPRWYIPLVILIIGAVAFIAVFSSHVGWASFIRHEIDANPRLESMPLEQREKVVEMQMKIAPIMGYVSAVTGLPVMAVVIATVLLLVFKYLLDAPTTFGQALGVVSWSLLPGIIGTCIAIALMLILPPDEFDLKNPTGLNIGYYLASESAAWMKSLLSSIDFFVIWNILLLATGMSILTRKPWGSALMAILIPWSIYVLIKTAGAALFG